MKNDREIKILLIDDDKQIHTLFQKYVDEINLGHPTDLKSRRNGNRGLQDIQHGSVDMVFLDYKLNDQEFNGLELLEKIRSEGFSKPIIMITGKGDQSLAVRAMKSGADGYLPKKNLDIPHLESSVRGAIKTFSERKKRKRELESAKNHRDELTGLLRRQDFFGMVDRKLTETSNNESSLLMVGIEDLQRVNVLSGPQKGDELLREVAEVFLDESNVENPAGRFHGTQFCLYLYDMGGTAAERILDRIVSEIDPKFEELRNEHSIPLKIRSAIVTTRDANNAEALTIEAYKAMLDQNEEDL